MEPCSYSEIVQCISGVKSTGTFQSEEVTVSFKTMTKLFAGIF